VVRQAGRAVDDRTQFPSRSSDASGPTALLTAGEDARPDDPRFTGGGRLTPAFGIRVGGRRRSGHDVPAFGSPEHSRLMTGSLDLTAVECAAQTGPLVGFAPVVLDPRGPHQEDGGPPTAATRTMPTRRSLRASAGTAMLGRPLGAGVLPNSSLPSPRGGAGMSGVTVLRPLAGSAPTTGALRVKDVERALDAAHAAPQVAEDPTPTGELARPFVDRTVVKEWSELEDVPPPVSVDVFQRAVRAGLAIDDTESLKALDEGTSVGTGSTRAGRSRRELRARERAATSPRSVAARRIAKGGVLAITALGVVSSATPQGLDALGLAKDGAARNTVDFASALAPDVSAPVLSGSQLDQVRRTTLSGHLRTELSDAQAANAVHAGMQVGGTLAELAKQQDAEVLAERQADHQRAVRDVIDNPKGFARLAAADMGYGPAQFQCLNLLWTRESQWNYRASNPSSGAFGIAQALPGSKMNVVGADWRTNPVTQIKWGLNYISERYGTPCGAWAHSQQTGWY